MNNERIIEEVNQLDFDEKVVFPKKLFNIIDSIRNEAQFNLYNFYENGDIIDISMSFNFHSEFHYELFVYIYSGHILFKEDKNEIRKHLENFIAEKLGLYSKIIFDQ